MSDIEVQLSFRVMSEDLDPSRVSEVLGLIPSESHRRGDPHVSRSGRRYSDYSEGLWLLESPLPRTASLDDHLLAMVNLLGTRTDAVQRLAPEHRLDLFVGIFGGNLGNVVFSISREVLQATARLGVPVTFDVYD